MTPLVASVVAIDDKDTNLRLLRAYLQGEPYDVRTFVDPHAALRAIESAPPDLILLDLMMPIIDGFGMLEKLKAIAPQVPVVIVTAMDDRDARLKGLSAGARDFLAKPVDRHELLIRVRNLVALKQSTDSLEVAMTELRAANRDLQAFAGSLAHDLQQPLTTIAAFAQVMESHADKLPLGDAAHLKRIQAAADAARRMIKSLLEFARLGQTELKKEAVDLNQVVSEALNTVATNADTAAIHWSIGRLPTVQGDASLLLLAFINLLSNAVKYTRHQPQPEIMIEAEAQPHNAHAIRVRDNGVGFDMAQAGKLFNPFERLHSVKEFEGTGMGLANVRRIVERHGGEVRADSATGQGAVFTVVLR
jgi:signal transduction histidine kinase